MSVSQTREIQASDAARPYSERLTRAQLIALTRQSRLSNFVPPVNSVILGFLLWGNVPATLLLAWVALVWTTSAVRWPIFRQFDAAVSRGAGYERRWCPIMVTVHFVAGLVWGVSALALLFQDSILTEAYLVIFVLGMGAGATASFAAFFPALVAYLVPLAVPVAGILVAQETTEATVLGAAGFVFLVVLL
ncbi:MAG: hypothetical protein O3B37_14405, partial [Proteobacteria bacterium]|nr:hypothetical protein [Pseudomonadota bacterium]